MPSIASSRGTWACRRRPIIDGFDGSRGAKETDCLPLGRQRVSPIRKTIMAATLSSAGLADLGADPQHFREPVVILAGGADREGSASIAAARALCLAAFADFTGTLISGGTRSGIAGLAGELSAAYPRITSVGY